MNLTRAIRFLLLMLFALLQCVAPLAHAHVNGNNADHDIHLAAIDSARLNKFGLNNHKTATAYLATEPDHSAVVCMPPEYRSSDLTVAPHMLASYKPLLALGAYAALSFVAPPRQNLCRSSYQHPCSRAPPA